MTAGLSMFASGACFMGMLIAARDGRPGMAAVGGLIFSLNLALGLR